MEFEKLEAFALAETESAREEALTQLIPGTEDYYFHTCLNHQLSGHLQKVPEVLETWISQHGRTQQVLKIERRQAALQYKDAPEETLKRIRNDLRLLYPHRQKIEAKSTSYPTALSPELISDETLRPRALAKFKNSLRGFTDRGLEGLLTQELSSGQLADLLNRLSQPDYPQLVDLIEKDLKHEKRKTLGQRSVHARLTTAQLDALAERIPELLSDSTYVNARIVRLTPNADIDWQNQPEEHRAYLERLWAFVETLPIGFNSLKAHVLYHRLVFDRTQGQYNQTLLLRYLQLPRQASYVSPHFLALKEHRHHKANLHEAFKSYTQLETVGNDEPLVVDYLKHLLQNEDTPDLFAPYIEKRYLDRLFATSKLENGVGDKEVWFKLLDPSEHRALQERIDLDFAPNNPTLFTRDQPVSINVDVKNIKTLVIKLYEINTLNYFLLNNKEVDTSVDLDGLVATHEESHSFNEAPQRKVRRTFTFDALSSPGVYVIELIGGGKSSRALIKKGGLRHVERKSAAGHAITVLDERDQPLKDATIWLGGREHHPREDGQIIIPYSTRPSRTTMLLKHDNLTATGALQHTAEQYRFAAGLYVDREQLLAKRTAQLLIRPALYLCNTPVSLELLEDVQLTFETTDRFGVSASRQEPKLELHANKETVVDFSVPEDLHRLTITLSATVKSVSTQETINLSDSTTHELNQIAQGNKLEDLFLSPTQSGYVLYLLGRTGEIRSHKAITLELHHHNYTESFHTTVQTDAQGRVELGAMPGVHFLRATSPQGVQESFQLSEEFRCPRPPAIHARENEALLLPWAASDAQSVSLLSCRGQALERSLKDRLSVQGGFLRIDGLPRGDYELHLKQEAAVIAVRITKGEKAASWLLSAKRQLEASYPKPLHVLDIRAQEEHLEVQLAHASEDTRVHLFGTRFKGAYALLPQLAKYSQPSLRIGARGHAKARYISGRDIGDEYRYILERRHAPKLPGSTLERPGILLNPWAVRKTSTGTQEAAAGSAYDALMMDTPEPAAAPSAPAPMEPQQDGGFSSYEFLERSATLELNLVPDAAGKVRVPLSKLTHVSQIRVVAVNRMGVVERELRRAEPGLNAKDLRLMLPLSSQIQYTEKQQISALREDESLEVSDITTSSVESFDTLERAFGLLRTLSPSQHQETLDLFRFVLQWPQKTFDQKCKLLDEHACHELHLFIHEKDRSFFDEVVGPYLKNKLHKTFMDHYLLDEPLDDYLEPWRFNRLNALERALLAGKDAQINRHLKDRVDLLPPDTEREAQLFKTALAGSALSNDDRLGFGGAQTAALATKRDRMEKERTLGGGGRRSKAKKSARPGRSMSRLAAPKMAKAAPMDDFAADMEDLDEAKMEAEEMGLDDFFGESDGLDLAAREIQQPFFRQLDKTEEWAENNYYKLRIVEQNASLIEPSAFWLDLGEHRGSGAKTAFVSKHFALAHRNFTEALCAIAVLDLPFEAKVPEVKYDGPCMKLRALGPMLMFHQQIKPAEPAETPPPILISQHYFREDDRYRYEGNERHDNYVRGELLIHTTYVCQVVLTNPTSAPQKLDLLMQLPQGALPVNNGFFTKGQVVSLSPYSTFTHEYAFYFPHPGSFPHYPVHASKNEAFIAAAEVRELEVVTELSEVDTTSWAYVSQHAKPQEVLQYLSAHNIERLELDEIAWRMKEASFYTPALELLERRKLYQDTLWSYSLLHNDHPRIQSYMRHQTDYLRSMGDTVLTPLVNADPVEHRWYEHLEYAPLVNARAHRLGKSATILNSAFQQQYTRLLNTLIYQPRMSSEQRLAMSYFLLLQDRIDQGSALFENVDPSEVSSRLQYDYLLAYLKLFDERPESHAQARAVAQKYEAHPVDRWRRRFSAIGQVLKELEGVRPEAQTEVRTEQHESLARAQASFDFEIDAGRVTIQYQNLKKISVNYYPMDIELLFSRQPFVQQASERFSIIKARESKELSLPEDGRELSFALPEQYRGANVVVELVAEGNRKAHAHYAHELIVNAVEQYGLLRVYHRGSGRPLPSAYIKVYGRTNSGQVKFYKDGYTDLRGAFDYASLSTDQLDQTDRLSVLILTQSHGAIIKEVSPPAR